MPAPAEPGRPGGVVVPHAHPSLTPEERRAIRDFWEVYDANYDRVWEKLRAAAVARGVPEEDVRRQATVSRELRRRAVLEDDWEPFLNLLYALGDNYARQNVHFHEWFRFINIFREELIQLLHEAYGRDVPRFLAAINGMSLFTDMVMAAIGEAYVSTKENIIGEQQAAMRALSTPVLQIRDRLLLLPLIGVIDTQRSQQLTDQLLAGIRANRARAVVVDMTGVASIDYAVANRLLQAVEAARLLGAKVIVTGISRAIAQTLVELGVSLGRIETVGDLRGGIERAAQILGEAGVEPPAPGAHGSGRAVERPLENAPPLAPSRRPMSQNPGEY
jgi:anti-anti-sigma regulatory factor